MERDEIPFLGVVDDYRIMLLEFPHSHLILGATARELVAHAPHSALIAHPERNKDVIRHVDKMRPFVEMGCMFQLTGASVMGQFGKPAQECAMALIERNWATARGNRCAQSQHRPPSLDAPTQLS